MNFKGMVKELKEQKKKRQGDIKEDESEELGALSIMMMGEHVLTEPPRLTDSLAFSKDESNPATEDSAPSITTGSFFLEDRNDIG